MKQFVTTGIILQRTDYGEADRILTLLTPDYGKLRLMAKGVRRIKSKLAGGVELFSVSSITFIKGRSDLGTLLSSRLQRHYGNIISDIDRTMLGYELIKQLHVSTEEEPEPAYFELLDRSFAALDDASVDPNLIRLWFGMQMLRLNGAMPNVQTDNGGIKLEAKAVYDFSFEHSAFSINPHGNYGAKHIKFLRLGFSVESPNILQRVQGCRQLVGVCLPLIERLRQQG